MGCPKNPKKFLRLIPYEGAHDYRLVRLDYYGSAGKFFFECERCACRKERRMLDEEFVRQGFDLQKLREAQEALLKDAKMPEFPRDRIDEFRETPYAD